MITLKKINVPYYKCTVQVILSEGNDATDVLGFLNKNRMRDPKILSDINTNIMNDVYNGAVTLSNTSVNSIFILLYRHTNIKELLTSASHELYHTVADIAASTDLKGDEALAYLQGHLGGVIFSQLIPLQKKLFKK